MLNDFLITSAKGIHKSLFIAVPITVNFEKKVGRVRIAVFDCVGMPLGLLNTLIITDVDGPSTFD